MDFDTYQAATDSTAIYPEAGTGSSAAINYALAALGGEVGSALNLWKKYLRGDCSLADILPLILEQLGDVQWYLARASMEMGQTLGGVAEANLEKLQSRKERGVLQGTGSNR